MRDRDDDKPLSKGTAIALLLAMEITRLLFVIKLACNATV